MEGPDRKPGFWGVWDLWALGIVAALLLIIPFFFCGPTIIKNTRTSIHKLGLSCTKAVQEWKDFK